MSQIERFHRQLVSARQLSEAMLSDFKTPEDWTRQVHSECNHALWFAGHMATVDNFFLSLIAPDKAIDLAPLQPLFGMGSHPTNNPADYPPPEEILAIMRERRATLLAVLDGFSDADMSQSLPKGTPAFLSDICSVFETAIWHEGMHSGQLSITRRTLGFQPVMG